MFAGWNLVLTLLIASLIGQSHGFWPFTVSAETDAPDTVYPDAGAKRIAIIGTLSLLCIQSITLHTFHPRWNFQFSLLRLS